MKRILVRYNGICDLNDSEASLQPRAAWRLRQVTQLGDAVDTLLVAGGGGAEAAAESPVQVD